MLCFTLKTPILTKIIHSLIWIGFFFQLTAKFVVLLSTSEALENVVTMHCKINNAKQQYMLHYIPSDLKFFQEAIGCTDVPTAILLVIRMFSSNFDCDPLQNELIMYSNYHDSGH